MGIEKIGASIGKEIIAWTRTSGKSLLATRPTKVNIQGLEYARRLERDTVHIKHRNLTSFLKKELKTPEQVEKILEACPDTSRCIGTLPYSWLDKIPKTERSSYIQKINNLFSDFANQTSLSREVNEETFSQIMNNFANKLELALNQKVDVSFLGKGTIGRTFKIKVNNEEFVIKTFFPDPIKYGYYSPHGKGVEICNACFASKHAIKGEFADFYFGNFARHNDNDGFIVTKFIDFKNARVANVKNRELNNLIHNRVMCGDRNNNGLLDTIFDYGGLSTSNVYNSKQVKILRLIKDAINTSNRNKFNDILTKYKGSDLDVTLKRLQDDIAEYFEDFDMMCKLGIFRRPTDVIISKIAKSDEHNKIYRLLRHAIYDNNKKEYDLIVKHYKDSKALDEILKFYNFELGKDTLNIVDKQIGFVESDNLLSTLRDFGLYAI